MEMAMIALRGRRRACRRPRARARAAGSSSPSMKRMSVTSVPPPRRPRTVRSVSRRPTRRRRLEPGPQRDAAPAMIRLRKSRPRSSVPNQWSRRRGEGVGCDVDRVRVVRLDQCPKSASRSTRRRKAIATSAALSRRSRAARRHGLGVAGGATTCRARCRRPASAGRTWRRLTAVGSASERVAHEASPRRSFTTRTRGSR